VPTLEALIGSDIEVAGVVTNPDRPAGRGMELQPSPVKRLALDAGIEVQQPEKARDPELAAWLSSLNADVATVVAYGKILPADLLAIPPHGFVNVHFSILPLYRGAAPVQRAVMEGRDETGVSIMVLTEGMDEGPVLAVETMPIDEGETAGEVGEKLALVGAPLLVESLEAYVSGTLLPTEQDGTAATYAPKITTEEARIDWSSSAARIRDLVRGLNPAPGAWTTLRDQRLKIHSVRDSLGAPALAPGTLDAPGGPLLVGTGDGILELVEVQMAGKKKMTGEELARGLRMTAGESFV
jgi:methionyl-tRNA formyltransferase